MLYKGEVEILVEYDDIQFVGNPLAPMIIKNMCAKHVEATIVENYYNNQNKKSNRFKTYWNVHFEKESKPNNYLENEESINLKKLVRNGELTYDGKEAVWTFPEYFQSIVEEGLLMGKSIDYLWEDFFTNTKKWCEIKSMETKNSDENEK